MSRVSAGVGVTGKPAIMTRIGASGHAGATMKACQSLLGDAAAAADLAESGTVTVPGPGQSPADSEACASDRDPAAPSR